MSDFRFRAEFADKCPSYHAAMKATGNQKRQGKGRDLNNRAENPHQPFR